VILDRQALIAAVQHNCDVADARHAGELSLCNYLLQMREFFRWQAGLPFEATLSRVAVGEWIAAREAHWDALQADDYRPIPGAAGAWLDPFDAGAVNAAVQPFGLVYGAGRIGGGSGRPVFFVADAYGHHHRAGLDVVQAGREWARGLAAPPAALAGGGEGPILIRRESLARWGWQGVEAHRLRPAGSSAWHAVVRAYGFDRGFDAALPGWLEDQVEIATLHELGEHDESRRRGGDWAGLRERLASRRGWLHATALRDHLADLNSTLPALLAREDTAPLHAWFSALDGVHAALFPRLASAYRRWCAGEGRAVLAEAVARGREHFEERARLCFAALHAGVDAAGLEQLLSGPGSACTDEPPAPC